LNDAWRSKIARNVQRDRQADSELEQSGWTVVRLWEDDIRRDAERCAATVLSALIGAGATIYETSG
jgi:DNA mismatch endonuclease (patch repair protein)